MKKVLSLSILFCLAHQIISEEPIDQELIEKAESGDVYAQYLLANSYYKNKQYENSFEWELHAAINGCSYAQDMMGDFYFDGIGAQKDYEQAFYWYARAAENGDADAQASLGYMYQKGYGTEKNPTLAFYWYNKSAEQDNPDGQCHVMVLVLKKIQS